jgi:hypothetical protein
VSYASVVAYYHTAGSVDDRLSLALGNDWLDLPVARYVWLSGTT